MKDFWLKSMLGIICLSLDGGASHIYYLIAEYCNPEIQYWVYKVCINLISLFTIIIPLLLFALLYDVSNRQNLYGLRPQKFDTKPYFLMLLIMLPILIGASFHDSFQRQYPMYKASQAHVFFGIPEYITVFGYEIAYGADFITVEFLFRGFFILSLVSILGRSAVLPMACMYCFLHFDKPLGEAISSIFGGYILGVIALETRGIWGGVIVHMGIAWLMELIAFIQRGIG